MAALTKERDTVRRTGDTINLPLAAGVKIFAGSLVARDGAGNATPGAEVTTQRGVGRALETVDNSGGVAGDLRVQIEKGVFRYGNSAAGDEITAAAIGEDCFIVDDQTVALTDGGATRSLAGKIFDVDTRGVWVDLR